MVQKEVAERICAHPKTRDYGALTVSVAIRGTAKTTRVVGKEKFTPAPQVDSAIVRVDTERKYDTDTLAALDELIRGAFAMKRKTLSNNLKSAYKLSADETQKVIAEAGLQPSVRAEEVDEEGFVRLLGALRLSTSGRKA
jgi:16S rRNA (adenine1518-N6/adenine1519-N6)-dimethyltransferase